ncbi:serine/threonine-protein kinase cdl1 [Phtheirospermum japonicum]|uniref:Serine/threonine-protein kinase cdl1 n=1 Tax=Phtheirospermum japonicum TaxID=374723 RepID=A0A830D8T4_9LAMI|nr:serine/threonine-protein kinase cdl1 [Phtheirospermum japonicum]
MSDCIAPESCDNGIFTYKSDMYNFGMLLLEIISGISARDMMRGDGKVVREVIRDKREVKLADSNLKGEFPKEMLEEAIRLASQCVDVNPALRPEMIDVMKLMNDLSPDSDLVALHVKPSVKGGESSQLVKISVKEKGESPQHARSFTLAAEVISQVEEALFPTIQRLEAACYGAVEVRSSGTIGIQVGATVKF